MYLFFDILFFFDNPHHTRNESHTCFTFYVWGIPYWISSTCGNDISFRWQMMKFSFYATNCFIYKYYYRFRIQSVYETPYNLLKTVILIIKFSKKKTRTPNGTLSNVSNKKTLKNRKTRVIELVRFWNTTYRLNNRWLENNESTYNLQTSSNRIQLHCNILNQN